MIDCCGAFSTFGLHPELVRGLEDSDRFRATKIQEEAIEKFSIKKHLILCAHSGTGKTCAFSILVFQHIIDLYFVESMRCAPRIGRGSILGLVLAHSPELCEQIAHEMMIIGRHIPLSVTPIVSSIKLEDDWEIVQGSHIVVATPGIIVKLLNKKKLKLFSLCALVIDEWDKVFVDKGLAKDIDSIIAKPMPSLSLRICTSATFSQTAYSALCKMLPLPWQIVRHDGHNRSMNHFICRAGSFDKRLAVMVQLLRSVEFHQALIFCNIRQFGADAETALTNAGFPCSYVSSANDQRERLDKVAEFRDLQLRCLVTTDLEARGLDVSNVNIVVCLDFPYDNETFLHRVGRSGRFMSSGLSLTFYKRQESKRIQEISEACRLRFETLEFERIPRITLPILQNEVQIRNFRVLKQIQQEKQECGVPLMPFCDMNSEYWKTYSSICEEMRPAFI